MLSSLSDSPPSSAHHGNGAAGPVATGQVTLADRTASDPRLVLDAEAQELLFSSARTSNSFSDEPVDDATLRSIWELTKWAPTAMNSNPLRVLYVRTPEGRERLLAHMAEGNRAKTASAPVTAVLAADSRFHEHMPQLMPHKEGVRERLDADEAGREPMWRLNAAMQAGYFILGVRAAGLAAGPMGGFDKEGMDAEFFAGTSRRSILTVNIGHPGDSPWVDRLPRLEYSTAVELV